jgi:tripartite-type tricarboxylate transporter receptor subunit TctC
MGHIMNRSRRKFLRLTACTAALPALPHVALALDYPTRPVHWIISAAPGGAADILARLMSAWISEHLGEQFIVESHPGAGGNIGTEAVVQAAPDGYTLHLTATSDAINATLYENLDFNLDRDLAPVAGLIRGPLVMAVIPSFPAKTVPEFIAYAKANPGVINFGSGGVGFATHVAGELFKMLAGVNMVHVPYRGQGPAMTGLLGGQVQILFDPVVSSLPHIRGGRLRPLAVTTATRSSVLPDVPPMGDFVPGYEASVWFGAHAPRNTPTVIVDKLNQETNAGLADPALNARLIDMGGIPMPMNPANFGKFVAEEIDKWAKVIKFANIKLG